MNRPPSRRLPAEWEPQSAVMLTWPHEATDWAPLLEQVEPLYTRLALAVARRQRLLVVCHDQRLERRLRRRLAEAGVPPRRLLTAVAPSDDSWARDHGPLVALEADRPVVVDFRFDGWGGKFPAGMDDAITGRLAAAGLFGDAPREPVELVLEGGAIESDGRGTLLATRASLLDPRRNPGVSAAAIERLLTRHLGLDHFLWLDHGRLSGDDTDGHIDTLARFAGSDAILHVTARPDDPDAPELLRMADQLAGFRTRDGRPYRLLPLPAPAAQFDSDDGRRLPASYANFLLIDGAVLAPVYGDPADDAALAVLRAAYPKREVVAFDCRPLIRQNGSLHCITMQFPAQLPLPAEESA